ncbi:lysine histidine transporter-like 8 [Prunus yedoensis var. nudiflora]|uniref:Lysine histidine transporter-like 8 n=1 Tax=Prunus yedoensis var. nudiflora TaxID=2094558 RepID=A0A314UEW8_PRUYE|nr:lysine histidine transporter-like 8 [Prunus yedoensis var. nudiflora]
MFFQIVCGPTCTVKSLTPAAWYLVFTVVASILAQLPNLNSIAGVSLVGAVSAIGYSTLFWVVYLDKGKLPNVSYDPLKADKQYIHFCDVLNTLGMIAFAFRGHNLIIEIQVFVCMTDETSTCVEYSF